LDGIAWDMTAPRILELMLANVDVANFYLPFFVTFDKKLREVLSKYGVKAVVINRKTQLVSSIFDDTYSTKIGNTDLDRIIEHFFSEDKVKERSFRKMSSIAMLQKKIDIEFAELENIL
jgi:hypothetical protein